MSDSGLRDVFDECFGGYEDATAEVELEYDKERRCWMNDQVEFWKEDGLGWCFRETGHTWKYGYDSLRDAVTRYCTGQASKRRPEGEYCASRIGVVEYRQKVGSPLLYCKATVRYFKLNYNEELFQAKCEALSQTFQMLGGM